MKILYSINIEDYEGDIRSLKTDSLSYYSLLDILHALGSSYIVLVFNYWKQEVMVLDGCILAFLYNMRSGIEGLKSKNRDISHVSSVEQGYHLRLEENNSQIKISGFNKQYSVNLKKLESALNEVSNRAIKDIESLYPKIIENKYYDEVKSYLINTK